MIIKTDKPFHATWLSFRKTFIPADASDEQVKDMEFCYKSGARLSYQLVLGILDNTKNRDELSDALAVIEHELDQYDASHKHAQTIDPSKMN